MGIPFFDLSSLHSGIENVKIQLSEANERQVIRLYKIEKGSVQETLIIPLFARKVCSEKYPQLFHDPTASEILRQLDYDFSALEEQSKSWKSEFGALEVAMRQKDLQSEVTDYLRTHPKAAVVNMGCGLDNTGRVCDNGHCLMYNLDFPDVIAVRNEVLPATGREENIACDLNDYSWMDRIDSTGGAVFFAAGVMYYFTRTDAEALFTAMAKKFPGGRMVFDSCKPIGVKMMRKTILKSTGMGDVGAQLAVTDASELELPGTDIRASSRGYMTGYRKPGKEVRFLYRLLSKIGDGPIGMKIVQLNF